MGEGDLLELEVKDRPENQARSFTSHPFSKCPQLSLDCPELSHIEGSWPSGYTEFGAAGVGLQQG